MEGSTFVAQCRAYKFWLESYLNISAQYRCLPILLVSARLSPERLTAKKTIGANFEKKKKSAGRWDLHIYYNFIH